jgi:hypothetical protein
VVPQWHDAKIVDRSRSNVWGARGFVMSGRGRFLWASAASIATAWVLAGCGQGAPPYEELPLRDALRAAPEVMATLPLETRRELAERLDAAGLDQDGATKLEVSESANIDSVARVADELREDQGQDALVMGEVLAEPHEFVVHAEHTEEEALSRVAVGPIYLRGRPAAETAPFEDAALRGRAGKWLRELAARAETKHMVRTTGVPFGAWAYGDTLYVNASWLVAMSALEESIAIAPASSGQDGTANAPGKTPLSIDYNPYNLPQSLSECVLQVQTTCQCGTTCDHEVTDHSFANAVEECAWVNQDPTNPAALCVLALMSIDAVRECMESPGAQCTALPVANATQALAFLQNTQCLQSLDQCLQDGYIPRPSTGSSSCNSCNNCSNCNNDCSGWNDSCSNCNDSCSNCNENCSECNQNAKDCNQNCSDANTNANNCGKCSVRPPVGQSPLPAPFGSTFWVIAPMAYLLLRGRRRS